MKRMVAALILTLAAGMAAAAPPGAETCREAAQSEAAWRACVAAVTEPCAARRKAEGPPGWAACLSTRAAAWEEELAARSQRLRALGHEAGAPAALAAFLAERERVCRDAERIAALRAEHGQAGADGAVLRCELVNSLHRAVLLDRLAREAERAAR